MSKKGPEPLEVSIRERTSNPDVWHPQERREHRQKLAKWAEARIFWARRGTWYPTRDARQVRPTPPAALKAMTGKAVA